MSGGGRDRPLVGWTCSVGARRIHTLQGIGEGVPGCSHSQTMDGRSGLFTRCTLFHAEALAARRPANPPAFEWRTPIARMWETTTHTQSRVHLASWRMPEGVACASCHSTLIATSGSLLLAVHLALHFAMMLLRRNKCDHCLCFVSSWLVVRRIGVRAYRATGKFRHDAEHPLRALHTRPGPSSCIGLRRFFSHRRHSAASEQDDGFLDLFAEALSYHFHGPMLIARRVAPASSMIAHGSTATSSDMVSLAPSTVLHSSRTSIRPTT